MSGIVRKRSGKTGLPAGSLIHIGEQKSEKVKITVTTYSETEFQEREAKDIHECFPFQQGSKVTWISIDGLHDIDVIGDLGTHLNLHPLLLEDVLNTQQRPKVEDFGDYLFITLRAPAYNHDSREIDTEQISMVVGPDYLISFQERPHNTYDLIQERLRTSKGRIRKTGPDFLAYSLIDLIVDSYFSVLEQTGEEIDGLEEEVVTKPTIVSVNRIHHLKRKMITLRKFAWPTREVINALHREESPLVDETTRLYFRDVYDHVIEIIDSIEVLRDIVSGLLDIYLSSMSNRLNEVMKVLTIISTIFIPLTFLAGVYGMNFKYMPELEWRLGYPLVLLLMLGVAVYMILYFKRKRWF